MTRLIRCSSIENAYYKGVQYVLQNGRRVSTKIPGSTSRRAVWQADPCVLHIDLTNEPTVSTLGPLGVGAAKTYTSEFTSPDRGNHPYTYGERLFAYEGCINQINYIICTLIEDACTRQAVATIWDPITDEELNDPPCMQWIHAYQVQDGLELATVFRSNDWYGALLYNLNGIYEVCKKIEREVGIPFVSMTYLATCPHIYMTQIATVQKKWTTYSK